MDQVRQAVITGVGVVCPIGIGADSYWQSLREAKSGVAPLQRLASANLPVGFGGEVRDFDPKQYVTPRKSLKVMSREVQLGMAAAAMAVEHSQLPRESVDSDRYGVLLGCDFLYCDPEELEDAYRACLVDSQFVRDRWGDKGIAQMFPLWMLKFLPNMAACHIGIAQDARGPNNTLTLGEVSSVLAIWEAAQIIGRGQADVMLAGGLGSRLNITPIMFRGDSNLSHRHQEPARACRPFDADRDGVVNAEGGAVFVLEEAEFAGRRSAPVLARLLGGSARFESRLDGQPATGSGVRESILGALQAARVDASQVGHVNANGAGTIIDDELEAGAIRQCLGDVPVTAPRSFFGNINAGAGAVELVASVLALHRGEIPITLNYETPDPRCPVNVVHRRPQAVSGGVALKLSQSSTGQAACLVLGPA